MELDQLLNLTSTVAGKLLPILGAVVLFFLIQFFRKLVALMVSANDAVKSLQSTLDSANKQLDMLDKPMHTLNEISETVDNVHEASKSALRGVISTLVDNIGGLVKAVTSKKEEQQGNETARNVTKRKDTPQEETRKQEEIQINIQTETMAKEPEIKESKKEESTRGEEHEAGKQ